MTTTDNEAGTEVVPVVSPSTLALFSNMAVGIPEADDSEAYEDIVAQILNADGIDDLNAPWETGKAEQLAGHSLKIESMARRASDYQGGLGIYIVVKGTDLNTGEKFTLTIGSVSVLATLAWLHYTNALPAIAELVIADRPTAKGNRPMHLKVLSLSSNQ